MALLQQPHPTRPVNKEFLWQDPVDDLFDSFINPDSFRHVNNDAEREYSSNLIHFFDSKTFTSGSDSLDFCSSPELDATRNKVRQDDSWHAALSFVQNTASPSSSFDQTRYSVYSQACGRSASSENDLLKHQRAGTPIPIALPQLLEHCAAPGWSSKNQALFATPLVVRKKPKGPSYSVEKPARRGSSSPKRMCAAPNQRMSPRQAHWSQKLQEATALNQVEFRSPFGFALPSSPPPSDQLKADIFHFHDNEEQLLRSPGGFQEDEPLSPLSNGYDFFQPPNTPIASPALESQLASPRASFNEVQASHLYPHRSSPYTAHQDRSYYLMTPPQSQSMTSQQWALDNGLTIPSPAVAHINEADQGWWDQNSQQMDPLDVTCGAPAASDMLGLGISGIPGANMTSVTRNRPQTIHPSAVSLRGAPAVAPCPAPRQVSSGTSFFSASASPNFMASPPLYAMSPLQNQAHMRQTQHAQLHHQRHHTIDGRNMMSPSMVARQACQDGREISSSPPPAVISPTNHRRAKSANQLRRKSIATAQGNGHSPRHGSVGFVNYTPDDSRKILTGVAPSGSSKTKARREKEAADRRRKLSEAAKKAVLEAGGDLGALEREGLLILGSGM